jgi:drug/metabolite transporter (DMT)-like permease
MSDYFKEKGMIAGIVLIVAGILLLIYPPLLSIIVAAFLIFAGALALSIARYNRKVQRHFDNPTVEFFFRY